MSDFRLITGVFDCGRCGASPVFYSADLRANCELRIGGN